MSMMNWSESGFGVQLYNGKNLKKIIDFVVKNDTQRTYPEDVYDCEDLYDLDEFTGDPAPWRVAALINELEGAIVIKGYQACGDTDQEAMIGIEPIFPWLEVPDVLESKSSVDALLKKYCDILGITEEPDYFDAQYLG